MAEEVKTPEPASAAEQPSTAPAEPAAAAEQLTPKERRARTRAAKAAASKHSVLSSPEERRAEHAAERTRKATARRLERSQARAKHKAQAQERVETPPRPHESGIQKTRQGIVVSDRAGKTITVRLDNARPHRRYTKIVRTSTTVHAHDEQGDAHVGDTVVVRESRPLSRTKRWRLVEVVERAR